MRSLTSARQLYPMVFTHVPPVMFRFGRRILKFICPMRSPFLDSWQMFLVPNLTVVLNFSSVAWTAKFVYLRYTCLKKVI
ncbi:hypothetical protein FR483_n396L [Paramecium bursaria Chlorella virus FR483]|uniref:Uncharacterized protein n396L n=1 Tax=Paramecium bursaria Chlorella virus FR483 TaxID=399781 RepID=A7J7A0_PBCVF|nr:hypothetical protein FR483_n396L [Paramecium bursaria Chlorella virus FR483]ABT15681.1 hypothetical protein FR483_n396L [Paramecium bursaria Chlorella virus FR483]